MESLADIIAFLKQSKKWWLAPIVVFLLLLGLIVTVVSGSAIAPFVYTLF